MKSSAKKIELASVDDLFSTEESRQDEQLEKIQEIPLSELHPFKDHPFKVKDDDAMIETADSIKKYGVLVPAIARPRRHSMNQIEIFNSPEFGSIRTLEQNGKVLFCGTDVATALGYTNPRKAVRDHTRGGTKCSIGVQTGKKADGSPAVQMVEMLFIPEGDLYRLIAHSKLPSAERFEQWVFDEVLPAIRKHGAYLTKEKLWEIATSPEALIKLCSELLAEREENASLREENALLESKAAFYDLFIDLNHSTNLRTTAKELLVPERRFVRFLLEKRFVYRTASGNVLPYAKPANEGLFCVKDYCNHGHIGSYTLITPQGKLYFAQLRDMILMVV